jgi:serine/threonine-protein phosphatase 6 catalytic subunit
MKKLCALVKNFLLEESNVVPVSSPVTICGDIHGQFYDLLQLFKTGGEIPTTSYIFMGDYVDRGAHSVETLTYLLLLKAKYPSMITLLRGNHETRMITQTYGFYSEIQEKYGNANIWRHCCEVFDYFPVGAVVDGRIFCVHGGISPAALTLDQIRTLQRNQEPATDGPFVDLIWSDPEDVQEWKISTRGAGWFYGAPQVKQFNEMNGLELICRSHQLVQEGYQYMFDESLATVWSAPNYCYRCGNMAAILAIQSNLSREFKLFKEAPESSPTNARSAPQYFL